MKKYVFDCNSNNAPAYSCSEPNDNSGEYFKKDEILDLIDERIKYLETNEMYPAFGLNSQVESLKQLKKWFE